MCECDCLLECWPDVNIPLPLMIGSMGLRYELKVAMGYASWPWATPHVLSPRSLLTTRFYVADVSQATQRRVSFYCELADFVTTPAPPPPPVQLTAFVTSAFDKK